MADAGQMNVYLNYFREHEMSEGDNPPVGLILCAQKNETANTGSICLVRRNSSSYYAKNRRGSAPRVLPR